MAPLTPSWSASPWRGRWGAVSCALAWLVCTGCRRPAPAAEPLRPTPAADPPPSEGRPPLAGAVADAGVLSVEPDVERAAARQDAGAGSSDAGPSHLPPFTPPRRGLVKLSCDPPGGRSVWFAASPAPLAAVQSGHGGSSFEVFEGVQALGSLPTSLGAQLDPQRQRLVRIHVHGLPAARVTSVVETDTRLVILLDLPVYCGGAAPFSPSIDVVVARSAKPIAVQGCAHGQCAGVPLP